MENYQVYWSKTAKQDLEEIIKYLGTMSENVAREKYSLIKETAEKLKHFPDKGRIIPELERNNITKYREIVVSPWRLMYKVDQSRVFIMALIDGRRNIEDILLTRQLR